MSLRSHILLIGAGLLSLSAVASAQPPAPPPGGPGAPPPANRAELKSQLEKRFDAADTNHDGKLSPEERQAQRTAMMEKMRTERRDYLFSRLDTNKDGKISKAEFEAAPPPGERMAGMERGRHGRGGWDRHHGRHDHRMADRRHGWGGPRMADAGPAGRGFGRPGGDGTVTRAQFVDGPLSRFDQLDTNHDGTISPAERDAARRPMHDRFAPADKPTPPPAAQ